MRELKELGCEHRLCRACVGRVVKEEQRLIPCPHCRAATPLSPDAAQDEPSTGLQTHFYGLSHSQLSRRNGLRGCNSW